MQFSKKQLIIFGFLISIAISIGFVFGRFGPQDKMSFLRSSPTPTLSPGEIYAEEMAVPLQEMKYFIDGPLHDWFELLSSTVEDSETRYDEYLMFYPTAFYYDGTELHKTEAYNNLHKSASAVLEAGFDVTSELGSIDPPQEVRIAHNELLTCFEKEVDTMNSILNLLETGTESKIEYQCRAFKSAYMKVINFIEENGNQTIEINNKDLLFQQ